LKAHMQQFEDALWHLTLTLTLIEGSHAAI